MGKKNGSGMSRARYLQEATQFLGLSARESMMLTPGQINDLKDLELIRRGLKKKEG